MSYNTVCKEEAEDVHDFLVLRTGLQINARLRYHLLPHTPVSGKLVTVGLGATITCCSSLVSIRRLRAVSGTVSEVCTSTVDWSTPPTKTAVRATSRK